MSTSTKRKRSSLFVAILLAIAVTPFGNAFAADECSITGHVYGPDGVTPLEGIRVVLAESSGETTTEAYTDSSGAYSFTGLRDWVFYIDFDPTQYNLTHDPDLAPPPSKELVEATIPAYVHDVVLTQFGSISGHVRSSNGEPLQGIRVYAFSTRISTSEGVYTDANGAFAFDRLPPDQFTVRFQTYEYNATHTVQYERVDLTWQDVRPGEVTTIEQTLLSWCSIAGRVTGPSGEALTSVRMYTSKPPYNYWDDAGYVDANGEFEFYRREGSYKVKAVPTDGVLLPTESDVVTLSMGSQAVLEFSARLGGRVKGHVFGPDGAAIPNVWVRVQSGMVWAEGPTDAAGAYDLGPFFSGGYTVTFSPSGYNGNNSPDAPDLLPATYPGLVSVTEGAVTSDVDVTLSTYCISGHIVGPDGLPVKGVLVSVAGSTYGDAETDANGDFTISDLAQGYYTVDVDPSPYNAENDPDLAPFTYYAEVYVSATSQPYLDFTMRRASAISGHVWDSAGVPLNGVLVWVDGPSYGETYTAADGSYAIGGLYPGWYDVGFDSSERNESHDPDYPEVMLPASVYAPEGSLLSGVDAHIEAIIPPEPEPQPVLQPVYRFYNHLTGAHFYTPSATECESVKARLSGAFNYEGVAYYVNPARNTQPLYRFYNKKNGSHFYTADDREAAKVMNAYANVYTYEGRTYSVSRTPVSNSVPIYRFYNRRNGSHFYTASAQECDSVRIHMTSTYTYEGPAFWIAQ